VKPRSISTRALVLAAIAFGLTAFTACSPEEQAAMDAFLKSHQQQNDHIISRTAGGPSDAVLAALRKCESHGNYRAVSRSGTYRGAYQFSRSTWNSTAKNFLPNYVGVDPAKAPPHIQDAMTRVLWKHAGSSPWPHCGRRAA
jgi:hypothetical protein